MLWLNRSWIGPILWTQGIPNLFQISKYFEKTKFEFSRFYCKYWTTISIHFLDHMTKTGNQQKTFKHINLMYIIFWLNIPNNWTRKKQQQQ